MIVDVVVFFSSSVPKVVNEGDGGLLAFVFVDGLKVFPGYMGGRAMLNVNNSLISGILSD